ncbi:preprotein translocase subunit SecE [Fictibacillus enclensis]|uniref:Protein translocase subunit SecE n=1 Tax=Fictibacillus enclensis TaxID=1017270 RepID=A0A0V8IUJ5_9BACL|nr:MULTISPECIES: preprotein translocase subunit SecE [Fictibacillus]KSU78421.1 preprotein translocase subunit SecE [Fictibacillus enclensis]MDM5196882.1 preprotein translocase subunit SecE [Fictibacillus enclensis]MDM5336010.1 preprotein translocase subunit SecE [Fictibacillus enclensis]RXZ01003.1 preprotein translocase subunit SecE [Fictibacillus sp. S7]WHY74844.1 preprotein translocase subunit SecE [Fictibacillus enclensis]
MADIAEKTRKSPAKFLSDVKKEMKKVSWPKRDELIRYTTVTIGTVIVMALFFWVVDLGISKLVELIVD